MKDPSTQSLRGFGYVKFEQEESLEKVLAQFESQGGLEIQGRRLKLEKVKLKGLFVIF